LILRFRLCLKFLFWVFSDKIIIKNNVMLISFRVIPIDKDCYLFRFFLFKIVKLKMYIIINKCNKQGTEKDH